MRCGVCALMLSGHEEAMSAWVTLLWHLYSPAKHSTAQHSTAPHSTETLVMGTGSSNNELESAVVDYHYCC